MTGLTPTFVLITLQQANPRLRLNNKLAENDSPTLNSQLLALLTPCRTGFGPTEKHSLLFHDP